MVFYQQNPNKIAVVNVGMCTAALLKFQPDVSGSIAQKNHEIINLQGKLNKQYSKFTVWRAKLDKVLTPYASASVIEDAKKFNIEYVKFEKEMSATVELIQEKKDDLDQDIKTLLSNLFTEICNEKGYVLLLSDKAPILNNKAADITGIVIKRLQAKRADISKNKFRGFLAKHFDKKKVAGKDE